MKKLFNKDKSQKDKKPKRMKKSKVEDNNEYDVDQLILNDQESDEEKEFISFFNEVLKKLPKKISTIILKTFDSSKAQAEKIMANSKEQYENVFDEFLVGVDQAIKKKCYSTIHAATLTAAIIGCSPIPFSDALLLVPVQLIMMGRLHKIFGQSWSENLGSALSKELIVVGLGRSAVGNLLKLVPVVGTVAGAAVNGAVASTITGALGWVTVKMLNDGEDIFDNVMSFKGQFNTLFKILQNSNKNKK
ncbi:YcjF family protein [Alkalibacterium kapii]|uniref:GTPase n=1 Tax=Alkalibacterium kapii TaxID=426704 RepID=A0A511ASR5_9LACT|nr:DUF697 domain-containing protein [Alkalibacterium kapii]GEK91244.1 GTPase [Alkalibacterium kapii]